MVPMVMNILNTVLGAGILSISNSFTFCGLIPSISMLTLSALFTLLSTILVIKMADITKCDSINELAQRTTGKFGNTLMGVSVVFFCLSCMTAYIIMSTEIIQGWLSLAGFNTDSFWRRALVALVYSAVFPIALTIPRQLTFINYASFFCFVGLSLYTFGMFYKGIILLPKNGIDPTVETGVFGLGLFNALGVYALSFSLAGVIIPIIRNMEPDQKKRYVATGSAFFISFAISLLPGVIGYLLFGASTKSMILSNFPNDDVLFIIVRVAILIVLTSSYPALGLTVLTVFSRIIYKTEQHQLLPWRKRAVVLVCQNIIPLIIGLCLPNVRPAMAIGGAFGAGVSNLVMPPLMYVRMSVDKWHSPMNLLFLCLFVIGTVACTIATYESVVDAINQFSH